MAGCVKSVWRSTSSGPSSIARLRLMCSRSSASSIIASAVGNASANSFDMPGYGEPCLGNTCAIILVGPPHKNCTPRISGPETRKHDVITLFQLTGGPPLREAHRDGRGSGITVLINIDHHLVLTNAHPLAC